MIFQSPVTISRLMTLLEVLRQIYNSLILFAQDLSYKCCYCYWYKQGCFT